MDDPMAAIVHGIEPPIANLRDGCHALFRIAEAIADDCDGDAAAIFFCVQAMQAELVKLQGLYVLALKARQRAKGGNAGEGAPGGAPAPRGPGRTRSELTPAQEASADAAIAAQLGQRLKLRVIKSDDGGAS